MNYLKLNIYEKILVLSAQEERNKILNIYSYLINNKGNLILENNDLSAFFLTILGELSREVKIPQIIVVMPSVKEAKAFIFKYASLIRTHHLNIREVFKGYSKGDITTLLNENNTILVGTPGVLLDLLEEKRLDTNFIRFLIINNLDDLFFQGYREDVKAIIELLDESRQFIFTDAQLEATKTFLDEQKNFKKAVIPDRLSIDSENVNKVEIVLELLKNYDKKTLIIIKENSKSEELIEKLFQNKFLFNYITKQTFKKDSPEGEKERIFERKLIIVNSKALDYIDFKNFDLVINYNVKRLSESDILSAFAINSELVKTGILSTTLKYSKKGFNMITKTAKKGIKKMSKLSMDLLDDE